MTAGARVRAVLDLAARLSDPRDPLGAEARAGLMGLGLLSKEGVELALTEHVERADDTDLDAVLAGVTPSRRVWVVASANVCVAPIRAIALGLAAAEEVVVKPSRRDPTIARILVRELARRGLSVRSAPALVAEAGDAVHAYGADATLTAIAASLPPGVSFLGHGTGLGLAVVAADDDLDAAATTLARDVVVFDQAGCLSPRACIVEGDAARGAAFADALSAALGRAARIVPRGPLSEGDRRALSEYERTMLAIGDLLRGEDHLVGVEHCPASPFIGPGMRTMTVASFPDATAATASIGAIAALVTAVGGSPARFVEALRRALPGARASELGRMQRPRFDGPVDRRG